jgi:hypothetical protein
MRSVITLSILGGRGTALEGRYLNSLGFQPQVGGIKRSPSPEGAALHGAMGVALSGLEEIFGARYLGLKPQAIQMPPLRGGWGTGEEGP